MIKLVYCITRKESMSSAQFFDYWRNVYGPIGAQIPGLVRLVQSYVVTNPGDRAAPDFDGMAELRFNSWEDLLRARSSPEWAASSADEANFINSKKVAYFVTAEYEIPLKAPNMSLNRTPSSCACRTPVSSAFGCIYSRFR